MAQLDRYGGGQAAFVSLDLIQAARGRRVTRQIKINGSCFH